MSYNKKVEIVINNIKGEDNSINNKSFVLPGVAIVSRGNIVRFSSIGTGARIIFPNVKLFDKNDLRLGQGQYEDLTVKQVDPGVYSYAVITDANNDLALGSSFPKFIVDRH